MLEPLNVIEFFGNRDVVIKDIVPLPDQNDNPNVIFWANDQNIEKLATVRSGTVICGDAVKQIKLPKDLNVMIVSNPRDAFRILLKRFSGRERAKIVAESSFISSNSSLGKSISIGHNVIIEDRVTIGDNTVVGHNTVIHEGTIIGSNVTVGCNNTIGGIGFGYEKDTDNKYQLIPHIGNVVIEDEVEIGNNTCIDRAVLGSTVLKKGCKIDNLVHIAHGVSIGENSMIIANSMIAGSAKIGDNVWIAPSASVLNKLAVETDSIVGMGAVVVKNVSAGDIIVGNPGRSLKKQ